MHEVSGDVRTPQHLIGQGEFKLWNFILPLQELLLPDFHR